MVNNGEKYIPSITIDECADAFAEILYQKTFKEIVTFQEIVEYAISEKKKNYQIASFIISVKKNYDPHNANDKYVVIQGLLDMNNKPITLNGKDSESRIIHTRTIDKKFIDVLNGSETKIIRL